mgnify:CR=1 FL=1
MVTVMDWVTAPLDHVFPVEALEVSTTLPPWQKESGPLAVTIGAVPLTVTVTPDDVLAGQIPLDTVTL